MRTLAVCTLSLLLAQTAGAAGFAVNDKSVSGLGTAFAGVAARAEDASVVYTNPAAMQRLSGSTLTLGLHVITPRARFADRGSTVDGPNPGEAGHTKLAPNLYYVRELSPRARFGVGVYAPFALGLDYDERWPGRYHTIESEMTTLNLSPALSWQLTPTLAVGGSLDLQYLTAELSQAVDFGALIDPSLAETMDGRQTLKGDNWAASYSLGLHYSATEQLQLGLAYHGDTRHRIGGDSKFAGVPAIPGLEAVFTDSPGKTRLHLPESVSLSAAWAVTERLTLLADYTWTAWSRHKEFRIEFANDLPDNVTTYNWRDVGFYALGLQYRLNPRWLLRGGVAYDESPVPDAEHRTPIGPDTDRRWHAVGINYAPHAAFSLDAALVYIDMNPALINHTDGMGHTLTGEYALRGSFASVQGTWRF